MLKKEEIIILANGLFYLTKLKEFEKKEKEIKNLVLKLHTIKV